METNRQIALRALTGAFINRDPDVVKHFTANYIQHNPTIPNGPAAIKDLIPKLPNDFSYQPGMAVAEGDLVMVHGRYVGWGLKQMAPSPVTRPVPALELESEPAAEVMRFARGDVRDHIASSKIDHGPP